MNLGLAEKRENYRRKSNPLLYLVERPDGRRAEENVIYSNRGLFYIIVIAIIFTCLGILLSIGLKIQGVSYEKSVYKINEMISLEEERSDRLLMKISELRSPSRIIEVATNDLNMSISDDFQVVEISDSGLKNNEKIYNYISNDTGTAAVRNYDGFLGTIYYIQDIVLVVSESVLTFFIP
jgi:cell division protein FtsL